jgi:hypothetical protein
MTALVAMILLLGSTPTAPPSKIGDVRLTVALVTDPEFPSLDDELVQKALREASATFAERFAVAEPRFVVSGKFTSNEFLEKYAHPANPRCAGMYAARYLGTGQSELAAFKARAIKFFERWSLDALKGFVEEGDRASIKTHDDVYRAYAERYVRTVDQLKTLKTPKGTPLVTPLLSRDRSLAAWNCALQEEGEFDVVITNTFILADVLSDPQPHAVFGKAKIGGLATQNPKRQMLGQQALLASTFGIDTPIPTLSELNGTPAGVDERASILGSYLLAHEIAHAIFGIPDAFDHPPGCLMTSRPGETYREGLKLLRENPGACSKCRPYVEARAALEEGRGLLAQSQSDAALKALARAAKLTPKVLHGGYKKRMSEISVLVSESYASLGNLGQAEYYAKNAVTLDPHSTDAQRELDRYLPPRVEVVGSERTLLSGSSTRSSTVTRRP